MFNNHLYYTKYIHFYMEYILIPLFLLAFILDIIKVIKALWKTLIGKMIYGVVT